MPAATRQGSTGRRPRSWQRARGGTAGLRRSSLPAPAKPLSPPRMINQPGRSAYSFDMSNLLLPLHGALAIVYLVTRLVVLAALIDSLLHPEGAYVASGKQTKWFWVLV